MERLNFIHKSLYFNYGMNTKLNYEKNIITNIILNKNCHIVSLLKDSMIYDFIDEFLKKYFKRKEIKVNVPKYVKYYKNYLRFFCKPTFRDFPLNTIIQANGERLAEIYYQKNYGNNKKKSKKDIPKDLKIIFSDTIRENINQISLNENNSSNLSIQLNQSSFRLLSKNNNNLEDFDKESITNLLNDLNGTSNTSSSNIHMNQRNKKSKSLGKKISGLQKYNSPKIKIEKIQINSNKETPIRNKDINSINENNLNDNKNNKIIIETIYKDIEMKNKNTLLNNNIDNFFLSPNRIFNKYNINNKSKLKLKTKSHHKKNTPSAQFTSKNYLTEENYNIIKRNPILKTSNEFINTNTNIYNKKTKSITESQSEKFDMKKIGIINLKTKNLIQLNKQIPNINFMKNKKILTSFNNFEIQQQLLNNVKNLKFKGSFNKSSRNNQNIISYTQTFSPQSNRPNTKYIQKNNRNFNNNKLYKFSTKLAKIA